MPETNYSPDPRANPLQFPPSRGYGSGSSSSGGSSDAGSLTGFYDSTGIFDSVSIDMFEDYDVGAITAPSGGLGWKSGESGRVQNGTIVSRTTHNSVAQKRLSLANGQYARKFPFGGKWNFLRMGILARINGAATMASRLAFGVCNGVDTVYADSGCLNFLGMVTGYDQGTTDDWTLSSRTQNDVFLSGAHEQVWRRNGSADTAVGGSFNTNPVALPATEAYLAFYYIEVTRPVFTGNTAITYSQYIFTAGTAAKAEFHTSRSEWFRMLTDRVTPNASGLTSGAFQGGTAGSFDTASVTETTGAFNAMCLWWENASSALEIAAIGVRKFN